MLLVCSFFGLGTAIVTPTPAADLPPNWPWRGIVMTSAASPNEKDIEYLSSINVNAVELQLEARFSAQRDKLTPEESLSRALITADRILDACKKYQMTVIISISQIPVNPRSGLTQESPEFWENPEKREEAVVIAKMLADHFKNRGAELGAYEILNEPLIRSRNRLERPAAWPSLFASIVKEIRKHDPKRYIVVTPGPGGLAIGYRNFKPIDDQRIIYGMHMYEPMQFTHQGIYEFPLGIFYPGVASLQYWDQKALERVMWPLIEFQNKYNVLVWVGEFSAARWAKGSDQYLKDLIGLFDKHGWGWTYFMYKGWHGWSPDFDSEYSSNEDARKHYIGNNSERWNLLRDIFTKNTISGTAKQK